MALTLTVRRLGETLGLSGWLKTPADNVVPGVFCLADRWCSRFD
ncbi:hypothetical protein ACFP1H_06540 [Secundilactobacillus hailunensis]|uniref:Uncharacterized protein n=1 Tax=Secundilactobacillus hailunensis TaxID=2559923 RepID=A0ABW1T9U8_9LACO|nr:hypothetical protein [Secundilactobacillus hailunensis]